MMKRTLLLTCLLLTAFAAAQAQVTQPYSGPTTQAYGKIDKADLEMTSCDFEKDANAEVLFDKGTVYFGSDYSLVFERHVRIKIFNEKGISEGNVRLEYFGGDKSQFLSGVQGETINLDNGDVKITKVDKKQMFSKSMDKICTVLSFAFPDVKAGSVIEYKYTITTDYLDLFPDWIFQRHIPTRYSEFNTSVPNVLYYKKLVMTTWPFVKNDDNIKSMANIPSLHDEPYMSSWVDNAQRVYYQLLSVNAPGYMKDFSENWTKVGEDEAGFDDFGGQVRKKLSDENDIISKAKSLGSDADKIAYVFDQVKNTMKWNDVDVSYTDDGTADAWTKKTGNSTEINMIVCHLLQKSGIKAYPMLVSTADNGKVNPAYPSRYQFNRTVTYIPVDSANYYVLDATSKFNTFNQVPEELLNGFGLYVDVENKKSDLVFLQNASPVREYILINAEIKPDGKMAGNAAINNFSYNRIAAVDRYKTDGEEKFIKYLQEGNNDLKISNLKFDNMEVDTLPLTQHMDFNMPLAGSDENYIYVTTNMFMGYNTNPFLSEDRHTNIDFKYKDNCSLNAIYKIPAGFKVDALPKSANMTMPDNSIFFRRLVAQQDDQIVVRYVIDFRKSVFFKENYAELHDFYKKMLEMMNEQIVLKKG